MYSNHPTWKLIEEAKHKLVKLMNLAPAWETDLSRDLQGKLNKLVSLQYKVEARINEEQNQ